ESFAPELILVSAGFDAAARDPLAEMNVSANGFGYMARLLGEQAVRSAKGRIALVLEGGYDLVSLEEGLSHAIHGAFEDQAADVPSKDSDDVADAARVAARVWKGVS